MPYSVGTPQATDATGSASNIATPAGITVSAGDTIVVFGTVAGADLTASLACTDGTNTYALKFATYEASTTTNFCILVAENVASGTFTQTLAWGGSTRTNRGILAVGVTGVKAASYQTGAIANQASPGTGSDGVTTGNMTPTEQPACVIGAAVCSGAIATPATGTGFTSIGTAWQFGTGTDLFRAEHQRITSTSALALTATAGTNVRHFSVAVILSEVSTTPTLDQKHFRWRNDDGSETTATWAAAEDTNVTIAALTPTRLRVEIAATANPASAAYKLQYRKVGDTYWRDVN